MVRSKSGRNSDKIDLKNLTPEKLTAQLVALGEQSFRGNQVSQWLYKHAVSDFEKMTTLSKSLQLKLADHFVISRIASYDCVVAPDSTKKYIFHLGDDSTVEGVAMVYDKKMTLCLSTQVGCPADCLFCLTGKLGFRRNLSTAELVDQFLIMSEDFEHQKPSINLVLMGMGEPLLNYDAVSAFLSIATNDFGFGLSGRRITLSTIGMLPTLHRFSQDWPRIQLAVSVNAVRQQLRDYLMPAVRTYPLSDLVTALRDYPLPQRRRITLEYILLKGINDSDEDAQILAQLCGGIKCKVNLIPFNEVDVLPFHRPDEKRIEVFGDILRRQKVTVMIRRSRGEEIGAACGQLGRIFHGRKSKN